MKHKAAKMKNKQKMIGLSLTAAMLATGMATLTQPEVTHAKENEKTVDAAALMPSQENKNVLVGYWHNWTSDGNDGYQQGTSANVKLSEVHQDYNVIDVSFMKANGSQPIPTFKPDGMSDTEFRAEVAKLNAGGRSVLIALGGADAHIELKTGDEQALADEIIRLVETYGFDGVDIDLEQSAITAGDNQTVIPKALKMVKDHYRSKGLNFMITMAPEFPYLKKDGNYAPYIQGLEGYYDFINPQFYNQAGDGFWSEELNQWVSQDNDALKAVFLYNMADFFIHGKQGFLQIPADKFVIGLPSNPDAAANGYVKDPQAVSNVLSRLEQDGNPIKGLMTWSINWDAGKDKNGNSYNNSFVKTYGPMIHDGTNPTPDQEAPTVPMNLVSTEQTATTIRLQWSASTDNVGVKEYEVYRNGTKVGTTSSTEYADTGLQADTTYNYTVKAVDAAENTSENSEIVTATTKSEDVNEVPPTAPTELHTTGVTTNSVDLMWGASTSNVGVKEYEIYRDGIKVGTTSSTQYTDTGLQANTAYTYTVKAVDIEGRTSEASNKITVTTKEDISSEYEQWDPYGTYNEGDRVEHQGKIYEAVQSYKGNGDPNWIFSLALWKEVN
ncbi:glycosyl hydrolase family 18 protein [Bacillus sp. DX1.1]|uniref:fibronectin type III domain-containing protein n=1 Tax=unclassified Bacillus (in: firmicutes) TaxID=185979 RepID=UPI00256FDF9E|nr:MULTISPECIES: glycosyl hydrolase family 18 protein [unclassified Bacillus (in: firmicutes)]MDM5155931.1 glycosyl hydrolase family 18 protein [Bacillus sp. DX1.1]WJE80225.1 glycosyl hydrolase family 18 protein [Bacillus sp. DX3.1]